MKKNLLLALVILWFVSCSEESTYEEVIIEEQVVDNSEENDGSTSTSNDEAGNASDGSNADVVTFSRDVQPIINNSCIACHTNPPRNGAPFPLLNFQQVQTRANSVFNQVNAGLMPPSGRLPQASINIIDQWIADGTRE